MTSNIYARNSIEEVQKSTKLYVPTNIDLDVHNPFPSDVLFNV